MTRARRPQHARPAPRPRRESVRRAAVADGKHLVYVHGICPHAAGYSDPWWAALKPYAPSIAEANRHEVLWSDLVTRGAVRAALKPTKNLVTQAIQDVLVDRIERDLMNAPPAEAERRALLGHDAAMLRIPGVECIDDFTKYLLNSALRTKVIGRFQDVVVPLLEAGSTVEVISHSWGTVVAYEALRRLDASSYPGLVHNLFTLGSALSLPPVRRRVEPPERPRGKKPRLVQRWTNLAARGDIVGGPLRGSFLVDDEHLKLAPVGCARVFPSPVCAHGSYFRAENVAVNRDVVGVGIEAD
jgi:metacaspase-1